MNLFSFSWQFFDKVFLFFMYKRLVDRILLKILFLLLSCWEGFGAFRSINRIIEDLRGSLNSPRFLNFNLQTWLEKTGTKKYKWNHLESICLIWKTRQKVNWKAKLAISWENKNPTVGKTNKDLILNFIKEFLGLFSYYYLSAVFLGDSDGILTGYEGS